MPPPDTPAVLVIGDDPTVLLVIGQMLLRLGCTPLAAPDGGSAVETYRAQAGRVALVLLDVGLCGTHVENTLRALRELDPALRCCLMVGSVPQGLQSLVAHWEGGVLYKPFTLDDLAEVLPARARHPTQ